ncbi:unnamed protein product [Owenia fusiformis]|uniref:Uncharacterized protein n=1 Tax=Owenia fusiformis TaxID=6347 RepID=A0A8J1Y8L6_OWEFU|nr:unnamed protein product [Owenia fusiformis]
MKIILFLIVAVFSGDPSVEARRCEGRRLCHKGSRMAALCCGCKHFFSHNGRDDVSPYAAMRQGACFDEDCIKSGSMCDKLRNRVNNQNDEVQHKELPVPQKAEEKQQGNEADGQDKTQKEGQAAPNTPNEAKQEEGSKERVNVGPGEGPVRPAAPEGAGDSVQQDGVQQADQAQVDNKAAEKAAQDARAARKAARLAKKAATAKKKAAKKLRKAKAKAAKKAAKKLAKKQAAAARKASRKSKKAARKAERRAAKKA